MPTLITLRSHGTAVGSMKEKTTYIFLLPAFDVAMATTYFVVSVCNKPNVLSVVSAFRKYIVCYIYFQSLKCYITICRYNIILNPQKKALGFKGLVYNACIIVIIGL